MVHLKSITVQRAVMPEKALDPAGALFFQVWLAVFTWIVTGALGDK